MSNDLIDEKPTGETIEAACLHTGVAGNPTLPSDGALATIILEWARDRNLTIYNRDVLALQDALRSPEREAGKRCKHCGLLMEPADVPLCECLHVEGVQLDEPRRGSDAK